VFALGPQQYGWTEPKKKAEVGVDNVDEVDISAITRPLAGTRSNNSEKVEALMDSIKEVGLKEPIDVLLVEGKYYGFSGCHRFEACQRLGHEKILAKVRKGNKSTLRMHMM
jgi:sulfiredoxin